VRIENRIRFDPATTLPGDRLKEIEVGGRMHLEQRGAVSGRSRENAGRRFFSNPVEHRGQPEDGFGMTGTGIVLEAGRMGEDRGQRRAHRV
jgi:hypothetical protein